ncbi:MAG: glycosyltransferase family 2 protein [Chryseotalea sp.]
MSNSVNISVVIITYNESSKIERCIQSVKEIADEVLVLDSFSTDNTVELAKQCGAKVFQHKFIGFTEQKNKAMELASHKYILSLDADEYVSEELKKSIQQIKLNWRADAYTFNRLNSFAGKWIKSCGWYPDAKIRLWNREKGRWQGGTLHEVVVMQSHTSCLHLTGDLLHEAFKGSEDLIKKMQLYSTLYANDHAFKKRVATLDIAGKYAAAWFKNYILKGGIKDGYEGFIISASNANGVLYKYAKLKERMNSLRVSLLITTYNRKDALELVLLSIKEQTVLPIEVIVADDGSREDTKILLERMAKNFPVPLIHSWQEDNGFRAARSRNVAMKKAIGEYIVMIDGDIVLNRFFIQDHIRNAAKGFYLQGSRVLLLDKKTKQAIHQKLIQFSFFSTGLKNRLNTIRSKFLSQLFSKENNNIYRVRSMNISFWKTDYEKINGFNNEFVGWGREDSEFAARMWHAGIKRKHIKFAAFGYHLYHNEQPRTALPQNQALLDKTIKEKLITCDNGLNQV